MAQGDRWLVEQMRRRRPECDLAKSLSVALREIAVAAQRRAGSPSGRPPSWRERLHGTIVRIDEAIAAAAARVPHCYEQVQAMRDRAETLRAKFHELTFVDAMGLATSDLEQRVQRHATGAKDDRDKLSAQLSETLIKLEQFQTDNADPLTS